MTRNGEPGDVDPGESVPQAGLVSIFPWLDLLSTLVREITGHTGPRNVYTIKWDAILLASPTPRIKADGRTMSSLASTIPRLRLSPAAKQQLEEWVDTPAIPYQVLTRILIVLGAAEGRSDSAIARELKVNRKTVTLWRTRFGAEGLGAVWTVAPGRGRKPLYAPNQIRSLVETARSPLPDGRTPWSCRELATGHSISRSTVSAILCDHGIQPYGKRTSPIAGIQVPKDLTAVVALYVNTPQKAIVLCMDEKCHALGAHLTPRRRGDEESSSRRTRNDAIADLTSRPRHRLDEDMDSIRLWYENEIGKLRKAEEALMREESSGLSREYAIANLDVLLRSVRGKRHECQRYRELLRFFRRLDRQFASDVKLHLILDTLGSRSESKLKGWLQRRPRFLAHVVQSGSDWQQRVSRCLRKLRAEGVECQAVAVLNKAILEFISSGPSGPFVWMAAVDSLPGSWGTPRPSRWDRQRS
jgi:transposase